MMKRNKRTLFGIAALMLLLAEPGLAQDSIPRWPGVHPRSEQKLTKQLVKVEATADVDRIEPGQTFHLAFIFKIEPKWHIYWKHSGASGGPTEIDVVAPDGFVVGETLFPRPVVFPSPDGDTYGYEDEVVLFVKVTAPDELPKKTVSFEADVFWLVCKNICLTGQSRIATSVRTFQSGSLTESAQTIAPTVNETKKILPQLLSTASGSSIRFDGKELQIRLPSQGRESTEFFPIGSPGVDFDEPKISSENDSFVITVPVEINPNNALGEQIRIRGMVGLGKARNEPCFEFDLPVSES